MALDERALPVEECCTSRFLATEMLSKLLCMTEFRLEVIRGTVTRRQ